MKLEYITFTPSGELTFTKEEVELLMKLSASHYDAHCREVGKVGGFLFGLNNRYVVEVPEVVALGNTVSLSFREIDTLCKILEQLNFAPHDAAELGWQLKDQLHDCLLRISNVCGLQQEVR